MCGDKKRIEDPEELKVGSPPHVRGQGCRSTAPMLHLGITPACAGTRAWCTPTRRTHKDHPRMCGDKKNAAGKHCSYVGSPPHVRGQVLIPLSTVIIDGITPACAGTRPLRAGSFSGYQDHPRMCGDKCFCFGKKPCHEGSPPHVRGQALFQHFISARSGITPACAGTR